MKKAIVLVSMLAVVIFVVTYCLLQAEDKDIPDRLTNLVLTEVKPSHHETTSILEEALLTMDLTARAREVMVKIHGRRPGDMVPQDDLLCPEGSSISALFVKYGEAMEWVSIPPNEISLTVNGKIDKDKEIACPPANKCSVIKVVWSEGKNNPKYPDNKFKICGLEKLSTAPGSEDPENRFIWSDVGDAEHIYPTNH